MELGNMDPRSVSDRIAEIDPEALATTPPGLPPIEENAEIRSGEGVREDREIERGDKNLVVSFYKSPITDLVHTVIKSPMDVLNIVDRPTTDEDLRRWPNAWKAFKEGVAGIPRQLRLESVDWLDGSMRRKLYARGVSTIEQLAAVNETSMADQGFLGVRKIRDRAIDHLKTVNARKDNDELRAQIAELQKQVAASVATAGSSAVADAAKAAKKAAREAAKA